MRKFNLAERFRGSDFSRLYSLKEDRSRGRFYVLMHTVLGQVISTLTTGIFYTAFLTLYGINIVDVGILAVIPYIAQLAYMVSPYILEHLPRRRWFLAACRLLYYVFTVLGTVLVPVFIHDPGLRVTAFGVLIFLGNVIDSISGQGYTVWHAQFLPDVRERANYFNTNANISNIFGCGIAIISALAADRLSGSAHEETVIVALRYAGFALAIADVLILTLPKEFPYPRTERPPRLTDVIVLPLNNKRFLLTMLILFGYTFVVSLSAGPLNYFLLNTVGVSFTYTYVVNFSYSLFLVLLTPLWQRKIEKSGWVRTFSLCITMDIAAFIINAFLMPRNWIWLYGVLRVLSHCIGVGRDATRNNLLYINLPPEDQTNYLTFYGLGSSIFGFLGSSLGTWFVAVVGDGTLSLFGFKLSAVPLLLFVEAAFMALLVLYSRRIKQQIEPDSSQQSQ